MFPLEAVYVNASMHYKCPIAVTMRGEENCCTHFVRDLYGSLRSRKNS
jgi:hypothetical protein